MITLFLESLPVRSFMFYLHQLTKYLQCFVSPYNECDLYIFFFVQLDSKNDIGAVVLSVGVYI